MPKVLLTTKLIRSAVVNEGKRKSDLFDATCKGLMLEVRSTGSKTYYLRYRNSRGTAHQLKLGDEIDISLSQARALADKARNKIAMGDDPVEELAALRLVPTFSLFVSEQYIPFVKTYKRSWESDASLLKNHLLTRFGTRHLDTITRHDIVKMLHERQRAGAAPGSANRLVILMRYIFNLAIKWEVPAVKVNPCAGVPLLELNNKMERYLSIEEAKRLHAAVCASANPLLRYIVPLLILTGARKREVLDAKWEDFDLDRCMWRISMTKSGKARHVPLSDGAMQILKAIPRLRGCDWLVPNPDTGIPFVSVYAAWDTARCSAGLADVRMHDLRHSFASLLVNQGRTLYEVQHLLGHTQVKTTQRYAHLSPGTLLAAANAATRALDGAMLPLALVASGR